MLRRAYETLSEILGTGAQGHGAKSGTGDLFPSNSPDAAKRHETFRSEATGGLPLPSVIIPASGDLEDFFATVGTYYSEHSPLSALVHVISEEAQNLLDGRPDPVHARISTDGRSNRIGALGAAVGEATLMSLEAHDAGGSFSYAACKRTLAFSLCRASLLYESALIPSTLAQKWTRLRALTGLSVSSAALDAVLLVHSLGSSEIGRSVGKIDKTLTAALRDFVKGHDNDDNSLLSVLVELYPNLKQFLDELRGAFDGRMTAFTRMVEAIHASSRGPRTDEIAVAFMCDRILPGSFAHAGALTNLVQFFPAALVWYGVFAAYSKPAASPHLSPNLISKLERDLVEAFSFEQRPRCDISLEELEVLSRAQLRSEVINPSQQRGLLVALLPGVDIVTRFGSEADSVGERVRREIETEELQNRALMLLEDALHSLKKAAAVKRDSRGTAQRKQRRGDS